MRGCGTGRCGMEERALRQVRAPRYTTPPAHALCRLHPVRAMGSRTPALGGATHTLCTPPADRCGRRPQGLPPFHRSKEGGRGRGARVAALAWSDLIPVATFLAPGALACVYALIRGKGDIADGLNRLLSDITQGYFQPDVGGKTIPLTNGVLSDLAGDEPLFKALYKWFLDIGGVYKLVFGPKAFIVISDPVVARHLLKENAFNYDKGVLAEILDPIMGKGLIPADLETWRVRRRAIVPAFHKEYYNRMTRMFGDCTMRCVAKLEEVSNQENLTVDMEMEFLNLGLDIIGLGVFNYEFGSISKESPVIKAVYGVLKEAEHRSTFYLPYWNLPLTQWLVPRQRQFRSDLAVINRCLDDLIQQAQTTRIEEDFEVLQTRDYSKVQDPSLLRFLVDMRGEDVSNKQLRDDLMTMLIAGHETTAAVLTWALFLIAQHPEVEEKLVREIDSVLGRRIPDIADIKQLPYLRAALGEALRLYPQPPILIRRALGDDVLPGGLGGDPKGYPIGKGADLFISVWNLHHSPHVWKDPENFRPERFTETFRNDKFNGKWAGYEPKGGKGSLYPNEVDSDFAFIPFGGGPRKCVGDQFALLEATVIMAMLLGRFRFEFAESAQKVGMATGATIHTANGLHMNVLRRKPVQVSPEREAVIAGSA